LTLLLSWGLVGTIFSGLGLLAFGTLLALSGGSATILTAAPFFQLVLQYLGKSEYEPILSIFSLLSFFSLLPFTACLIVIFGLLITLYALVAGSALAWQRLAPLVAASKPKVLPSEALEPCEADDYLLAGGVIPPLILGVALYSPHTLARPLACCHKEAAKEIEKLEETWRERGAYLDERLYALGLALSVAEAKRLGEKVEVWEAEAALYAAAAAVQKASRVECVAAVLEMFKPLGELAPHYHVKLASLPPSCPSGKLSSVSTASFKLSWKSGIQAPWCSSWRLQPRSQVSL